jgi:hypothetical protein
LGLGRPPPRGSPGAWGGHFNLGLARSSLPAGAFRGFCGRVRGDVSNWGLGRPPRGAGPVAGGDISTWGLGVRPGPQRASGACVAWFGGTFQPGAWVRRQGGPARPAGGHFNLGLVLLYLSHKASGAIMPWFGGTFQLGACPGPPRGAPLGPGGHFNLGLGPMLLPLLAFVAVTAAVGGGRFYLELGCAPGRWGRPGGHVDILTWGLCGTPCPVFFSGWLRPNLPLFLTSAGRSSGSPWLPLGAPGCPGKHGHTVGTF